MRMSRRAVLHGIGGVEYSYTGTFDSYGNASQGYLVLKTSGTLTIKGTVDLCLVGGGGSGGRSGHYYSGGGGAGGYVENFLSQNLSGNYTVTIGAGAVATGTADAGTTSVGTAYTALYGTRCGLGTQQSVHGPVTGRGTGAKGRWSNGDGASGEDGVYPWDDSTNFASYRVSGTGGAGGFRGSGGSACVGGAGGAGGGGAGGSSAARTGIAGTANTGGGGGGGGYYSSGAYGGNGGTGVVFVRWGY